MGSYAQHRFLRCIRIIPNIFQIFNHLRIFFTNKNTPPLAWRKIKDNGVDVGWGRQRSVQTLHELPAPPTDAPLDFIFSRWHVQNRHTPYTFDLTFHDTRTLRHRQNTY